MKIKLHEINRVHAITRAILILLCVCLNTGCTVHNLRPSASFDKYTSIFSWTPEVTSTYGYIRYLVTNGISLPVNERISIAVANQNTRTSKIIFSSDCDGDSEIYLIYPDGSGLTKLTDNTIGDYEPELSPLGDKIAFSSYQEGNQEIYVMNADGTDLVRLTNNFAHDWDPTWSPDGTKIAFISDCDGINQLWEMQSNGDDPIKVSSFPAYHPAYSPNENKIAFVCPDIAPQTDAVFIVKHDGSTLKELTRGHDLGKIAWSPDGQKIAVPGTMQSTLVIFNVDGSQNSSYKHVKYDPAWSPDGKRICYLDCLATPPGLVIMNTDNNDQVQITTTTDGHPSWR